MSRTSARILVVATVFLLPSIVLGQGGGSGSVVGAVFDQVGQPMGGVKIIATSPTQVGGEKVTYSGPDGQYRFVGLMPGVFDVTASAPKMTTVHQKGIAVGVNSPAEVDLVMEVQTKTEEVKVIERAPIVSTKTAAVKEQYDGEFLDTIPSDFKAGAESVVATSVPGSVVVGSRGARIRGGAQNHSAFMVEGFYMNGQRSTLKGMSAVEVQSAGYGAEFATVPGGVINMVTKSGSNKHEIDIGAYAEDNHFEFFRDATDSRLRSYFYVFNPNVSGPIIKDKLWYSLNFEARPELTVDPADPLGVAPNNPDYHYFSLRGSLKLTYQLSARNKLASYNNFNLRSNYNNERGYGRVIAPESQVRQDDRDFFTGLIWESLLTDKLFFKSQIGLQRFMQQLGPQMCDTADKGLCDHVPATVNIFPRESWSGNARSGRSQTVTRKVQFINTLEYFADSKVLGSHDIRLKNDYQVDNSEWANSVPGNIITQVNGLNPDRQTEYFSNDPRVDGAARYGWFIRSGTFWKNSVALSDAIRPTRGLTVTPGVAFTMANAENAEGINPLSMSAFTPHLAVAWDATGDGRTVIRGSFNQYVDVDLLPLSRFMLGSQVNKRCGWDAATSSYTTNCEYSGGLSGRTVGLPCGPSGFDEQGRECKTKLKTPRTTEWTIGAEREVLPGVALGGDLVYRKYANQYELFETNRIWASSGTDYVATGRFRSPTFTGAIQDLETPEGAQRTYRAATVSAHKREGALKINAGYTLSYLEGTVLDGFNNPYGDIGPRDIFLDGYLPDDSRHSIRATANYSWTKWLTTGVLYDYRSGRPYQRRLYNTTTASFETYRARVGINPGNNLNDPSDDRELRLNDIQQLNLQVRINWLPLTGLNLDTYADVLNALALRTTTAVQENDGTVWGTPIDRLRPFRLRVGLNFRW